MFMFTTVLQHSYVSRFSPTPKVILSCLCNTDRDCQKQNVCVRVGVHMTRGQKASFSSICTDSYVHVVQYGLQRTAIAIYTLPHAQLHIGTNNGHYSRAQPIAMFSYYRQN